MNVSALAYVETESTDPGRWASFAPEVLGAPLAGDAPPGDVEVRFDERHHRIAVRPGSADGLVALGWELAAGGSIRDAFDELAAKGLDPVWTTRHGWSGAGDDIVAFGDPFGYRHELVDATEAPTAPFAPARDIAGFLAVGHAVVGVPEREEAIRFYTETMGFRLSDRIDVAERGLHLAFLRCSSRHHSLAVYRSDRPNLLHIMVEVAAREDVESTLAICEERGVALSEVGQHSNDRTISFYLRTPSAFEIEYGFGSLEVDEDTWEVGALTVTSEWGHRRNTQARP
ncbi:MAG TPA: VOC family protein [Actinomycetota bacterium]|nr:VOC family protein [Actinomycetota bacterium]